MVIGKTPTGDPSLRIPHDPSDCTSNACENRDATGAAGAIWARMDRLLNVPFSYIFRDLAGR